MSKQAEHSVNKAVDSIQQRLTDYAVELDYHALSTEAVHIAKERVIDTLGGLIVGFFGEPCRIARNLAATMPDPHGATVIGTRMKTTPDMAAFVNATTVRFMEINDSYLRPGSSRGHPSDALTPVLAAAEHAGATGRDFITSVVLAYEVYTHVSDALHNHAGWDNTICGCVATAVASGKLFGLSPTQLSHCISMAVVPNNILRQVRRDHASMFKEAAAGQAGRAGVFAALLARAGMEGPHLPFEGKAGWCDHVAGRRFSLPVLGGKGTPLKILDTIIKTRTGEVHTIPPVLATEKVAPLKNPKDVKEVTVEVYKKAMDNVGTGEHHWNPTTREDAADSVAYVIAATLMEGTVGPQSFDDAHLRNPDLRALLPKIKVIENAEFTQAYERMPQEYRARVTVVTGSGERLVGESGGGDQDDLAGPKSEAYIGEKFRRLTEDYLGAKQVKIILDRLWSLEDLDNVAEIPPAFIVA